MPILTGATGFDPAARRRVRRAGARARPWLLPGAVVLAALVVPLRVTAPVAEPPPAGAAPRAPHGRVLVAVTPSDPAVLGLVVPGARVDVYAAAPLGLDGTVGLPAALVADAALVVDPTGGEDGSASSQPAGPLSPAAALATGPTTGGTVALAVTDAEAAALAARPGSGLTLAVRSPDG